MPAQLVQLFYLNDTNEHMQLLIHIFPYVHGSHLCTIFAIALGSQGFGCFQLEKYTIDMAVVGPKRIFMNAVLQIVFNKYIIEQHSFF